jgi:hypothetical protein
MDERVAFFKVNEAVNNDPGWKEPRNRRLQDVA